MPLIFLLSFENMTDLYRMYVCMYVCIDFTPTNITCQVLSQIILHIIILIISHLLAFVIILKYDFTNFIVVHNYGLHLPQGVYPSFIASSRVQFK